MFAAASLLLPSCRDEADSALDADGCVRFAVVDDRLATRSSGDADGCVPSKIMEVRLPVQGKSIEVSFMEEGYSGTEMFESVPQTRGSAYVTETVQSFSLKAYKADGTHFFGPETLDVTQSGGKYMASATFLWPDRNLTFFADYIPEAEVSSLTYSNLNGKPAGSFSYSLPEPSQDKQDPLYQKDMIFAITPDVTKASAKNTILLAFHHALSAVMFRVGSMPDGVSLKNISLVDFHSSGECSFGMKEGSGKTNDVLFNWALTDERRTYCQDLKGQEAVEDRFLTDSPDKTTDPAVGSGEYTFMMIPQPFDGTNATLVLNFNVYGKDYTLTKKMSDIISEFKADTKYIIRIGINEVTVKIEENFDGKKKENVYLRNTGNTDGYIRAALVGCWVNKKENGVSDVMVPWREDDGIFVWGADWDTHWVKGADGFYYHKQKVAPGATTAVPLFQSYTLISASPIAGATLTVNIVAQIVAEGCLDQAWPGNPL